MFKAIYPDGREEVLLRVPNYDFNWQTSYELATPKFMPRGTTLVVIAHFDNSHRQSDTTRMPRAEVRWGDQTWEEMLIALCLTCTRLELPRSLVLCPSSLASLVLRP